MDISNVKFNITNYIKSKENLKGLDFMTAYITIVELIKDGKLRADNV